VAQVAEHLVGKSRPWVQSPVLKKKRERERRLVDKLLCFVKDFSKAFNIYFHSCCKYKHRTTDKLRNYTLQKNAVFLVFFAFLFQIIIFCYTNTNVDTSYSCLTKPMGLLKEKAYIKVNKYHRSAL
jgi:hypothetical protein